MIIINCPMHSLFTQKRKVFPSWKVSHSAKEKKKIMIKLKHTVLGKRFIIDVAMGNSQQ